MVGFQAVAHARTFADRKWGKQDHHPLFWLAVVGEEYGEACEAAMQQDWEHMKLELAQIGAACTAAIEALHRGQWDKGKVPTRPVQPKRPSLGSVS